MSGKNTGSLPKNDAFIDLVFREHTETSVRSDQSVDTLLKRVKELERTVRAGDLATMELDPDARVLKANRQVYWYNKLVESETKVTKETK